MGIVRHVEVCLEQNIRQPEKNVSLQAGHLSKVKGIFKVLVDDKRVFVDACSRMCFSLLKFIHDTNDPPLPPGLPVVGNGTNQTSSTEFTSGKTNDVQ
jgi:hypothetical protein